MNNVFVTYSMHGMTIYEVNQHRENCYGTRQLAYVPDVPPTEAELAEMAREEASYEAAMRDYYGTAPWNESQEPNGWQYGFYKTEEASRRATQLHDYMNNACDDVKAWGAPSECYTLAISREERELEELDQKFGTYLNPPNPWLERGLEDRRQPIGQLLLGDNWKRAGERFDDFDIAERMGERPAVRRVWP